MGEGAKRLASPAQPATHRDMNILLIGSGGREHALAWKIAQSPRLGRLYAAPGNPGIGALAEQVRIDPTDQAGILAFGMEKRIDLAVIGPEQPLVGGLADTLTEAGIPTFGPSGAAAALEGSKSFTKRLCDEAGIPTARYAACSDRAEADAYIRENGAPIVVKADGLAAGKGVTVAETVDDAMKAVAAAFASDGASVVIEEALTGTEASLFALCDGRRATLFGTAQDYKRALDGDRGPNTGGMGAISPAPTLSPELAKTAMKTIVQPTIDAMASRGTPYRGVLYAGLMITPEGPKLIEYNVRFGDPECQVLMPRLGDDLVDLLSRCADGELDSATPSWSSDHAVTVVMANSGYPGAYEKGGEISGIEAAESLPGVVVFQAGTSLSGDGRLTASGGRVLAVTATAATADEARERAYEAVSRINWPGAQFRTDIAG